MVSHARRLIFGLALLLSTLMTANSLYPRFWKSFKVDPALTRESKIGIPGNSNPMTILNAQLELEPETEASDALLDHVDQLIRVLETARDGNQPHSADQGSYPAELEQYFRDKSFGPRTTVRSHLLPAPFETAFHDSQILDAFEKVRAVAAKLQVLSIGWNSYLTTVVARAVGTGDEEASASRLWNWLQGIISEADVAFEAAKEAFNRLVKERDFLAAQLKSDGISGHLQQTIETLKGELDDAIAKIGQPLLHCAENRLEASSKIKEWWSEKKVPLPDGSEPDWFQFTRLSDSERSGIDTAVNKSRGPRQGQDDAGPSRGRAEGSD